LSRDANRLKGVRALISKLVEIAQKAKRAA
jgi:hypothetical protein